jgi:hypothetical protein
VRRRRLRPRPNPTQEGLDTNTIVLFGLGTCLIGAIVYAVYQISQTQETLSETNEQIGSAVTTAQGISGQIPGAVNAAQNVSGSIQGATGAVQGVQQSPIVSAANSAVSTVQGWFS